MGLQLSLCHLSLEHLLHRQLSSQLLLLHLELHLVLRCKVTLWSHHTKHLHTGCLRNLPCSLQLKGNLRSQNRIVHYLLVMIVYELLNSCERSIFKVYCSLWYNFLNFSQAVLPSVDISDVLKNLSRKFSAFISLAMNKMAKISSCTTSRTMVVSARNCTVVARLNDLVRIRGRISC